MNVVVAGCGPTVSENADAAALWTRAADLSIGVNDVGRWLKTDHLVVLDKPELFVDERKLFIESTVARTVWLDRFSMGWFWQYDPYIVEIESCVQLGAQEKPGDGLRFPPLKGTPLTAACLAFMLGASWIGLIGVDITTHPSLKHKIETVTSQLRYLERIFGNHGCELRQLGETDLGIPFAYEDSLR